MRILLMHYPFNYVAVHMELLYMSILAMNKTLM